MIKVKDVSKYYGPHLILDKVTFEVTPGKLIGFLGPNGAGKTSTMKILSGHIMPNEGDVWIDDVHLQTHPIEAKKKLGYLPEVAPLYDDMNVDEYLLFVARLKGSSKSVAEEQLDKVVEQVALNEYVRRPIYKLSKGYRQRVGLAQAIINRPKVLLLDEPTNGFDPKQASEFRQLLLKLKGEMTIFLSTHLLSEVQSSCDEIVVIDKGRIITQGSYSDLTQKLKQGQRLLLYVKKSSNEFGEALDALSTVSRWTYDESNHCYRIYYDGADVTDSVLQLAIRLEMGIVKVESDSKDLESLFLELTSQPTPEVKT